MGDTLTMGLLAVKSNLAFECFGQIRIP